MSHLCNDLQASGLNNLENLFNLEKIVVQTNNG